MKIINQKAFTLIELLVVIAIISILSSILIAAIDPVGQSAKARDAQRLTDMKNIQQALELYLLDNGEYPEEDSVGSKCDGWDTGNQTWPILNGRLDDYFSKVPVDPIKTDCTNGGGYRYYKYPAGSGGCDVSKGAFYVLGVSDMETSGRPHPDNPGWSCSNRDWSNEFDWVTGHFEN